jgi:hypothetical protein
MARYQVYNLDRSELVKAGEIEADSDDEAVRIAREHGTGDHVEVWKAGHRLRTVAPLKPAQPRRI